MQAIYENGSKELYCRDSRFSKSPITFRAHLHYQIELAILFGGCTKVSVNSKDYEACAGDAFIVFPNQIHSYVTLESEDYVLLKINPEYIPELLPKVTSFVSDSPIIKNAANDEEIAMLIRKISEAYYGDEPFRETILRGLVLVFLSKLLQKTELHDTQSADYHIIGHIMNYCNKNYNKNLTLSILSKELHLNKYYISHVISSRLNIGFNDYINSLRVSNACNLLIKNDLSITEISEIVGFNTLRTFNRAFNKQMGCTPSQYRRNKKSEGSKISAL